MKDKGEKSQRKQDVENETDEKNEKTRTKKVSLSCQDKSTGQELMMQ